MSHCPECQEWTSQFTTHHCAPLWYVWEEGEEEGHDPEYARSARGHDAEAAALHYADNHQDEGPQRFTLHIAPADGSEPPRVFEIDYYIQPVFTASEIY